MDYGQALEVKHLADLNCNKAKTSRFHLVGSFSREPSTHDVQCSPLSLRIITDMVTKMHSTYCVVQPYYAASGVEGG